MPGLYKRKRPTEVPRSSGGGNGNADDTSYWHSTPINPPEDGATTSTSGTRTGTRDLDPASDEELIISPLKRPTLGEGIARIRHTEGFDSDENTPGPDADNNTPEEGGVGPSSVSIIRTPSAAVNVRLDEGDEDLFEEMEVDEQPQQRTATATSGKSTVETRQQPGPSSAAPLPIRERRRSPSPEPFVRPEPPRRPPVESNAVVISQRFGPVEIHAPSGHSHFAAILHQNGFVMTFPKNILFEDVVVFREKMKKWLFENTNEESRIEDRASRFKRSMRKYFSVKENLTHACTTTLSQKERIQPSLLACLLGISVLQKSLLEVVLPSLSDACLSPAEDDADFASTIVSQMRWLPMMVDGKALAIALMGMLDFGNMKCQRHIIRLLPEIFLPEYHPDLIPKLLEMFDRGTSLNVIMLDCFSCLVIPEVECVRLRRSIVEQMSTAALEDVPAYISFLFKVGSPLSHLEEGIREMREKLEIKVRKNYPKDEALVVEVLERIRFYVSVNPLICKVWIKQLNDDLSMDIDLPALDMLMLLVFLQSNNKKAELILKTIFVDASSTNKLLDKLMENCKSILQEMFPTIARFLDSVLRTKASKCHEAAADVTKKLFVQLGPIQAQHLTTNLIGVLINGHPTCRDVALKIFTSIAETDAPKLLYFNSYLMGALVYVIKYPPRQMQALMNVLAIIAFKPILNGEENAFTAEFMILLRKQITHANVRTKCFGVLGTVAAVKQLALTSDSTQEDRIDQLLALAWSSIENDEEACSIFFDEMISCVSLLPRPICQEFCRIIKMQFEQRWTVGYESDVVKSGKGQGGLELLPAFEGNHEMEDDSKLVLVLEQESLQMSPLVIPSLLRVFAELSKIAQGNLEDIDTLLGCPILMPSFPDYYDKDLTTFSISQKNYLGMYLVLALNYMRECISAFVDTVNMELRVKIWMRLGDIIRLQKYLVKHVDYFPNLPLAYGAEKSMTDSDGPGFSGALMQARKQASSSNESKKKPAKAKGTKAKKPKRRGKKKTATEEENEDDDIVMESSNEDNGDENPDDDTSPGALLPKEEEDVENQIQPKSIFPYIRRIDPKVFGLLIKFPFNPTVEHVDFMDVLLNLTTATQNTITMRQIELFNLETLALLLAEMKRQHLDKKCDFNMVNVDKLLESLCGHVDVIGKLSRDDDIPEAALRKIDSCLRLLLTLIEMYFESFSKLTKERRKVLVEELFTVLSSRTPIAADIAEDIDDSIELDSQSDIIAKVGKYIASYANCIGPDFRTAEVHVRLLKTVHDLLPKPIPFKSAVEDTIKNYLQRSWKIPAAFITYCLKTWFATSQSTMEVAQHLTRELMSDDPIDSDSIPFTDVYQSCNKINFHTWYSAILSGLTQHMIKAGRKRNDLNESLKIWKDGNELFITLASVAALMKRSLMLVPLLRFGKIYYDTFVTCGIIFMGQLWKSDLTEGHDFTKTLQKSTRKIQSICDHSKLVQDGILLRHVPPMKRTLEILIFRVREVVGQEVSADAFWMGPLKHRNLEGDVIGSQMWIDDFDDEDSREDGIVDPDAEEGSESNDAPLDESESNYVPLESESEDEAEALCDSD